MRECVCVVCNEGGMNECSVYISGICQCDVQMQTMRNSE